MKYCPGCKKILDDSFFSLHRNRHRGLAPYCKVCFRERGQRYYTKNKKSFLKSANASYKKNKVKILKRLRKFYKNHKNHFAKLRLALRKLVLDAYGGICIRCGESRFEFLSLDHKANNGHRHRRKIKVSGSSAFMSWLKRNNFPDIIQLLCHNHNRLKFLNFIRKKSLSKKSMADAKYRVKYKAIVIEHYGGKCICCREANIDVLSIHHVDHNGKKDRIKSKNNLYRFIIKNKFPKRLEILCCNCHGAISYYGYCPHKKRRALPERPGDPGSRSRASHTKSG